MKYLVGIDEGTTACKAVLFSEEGRLISSASREYPSYYPNLGRVEYDINEIKESVETSGVDPADIAGISHSNQGITMVLLDENNNPVSDRVIGWQDLRYIDEYWRISGMSYGAYNIPVLKWIQKYEPEKWSRVKRICSHQDYFLSSTVLMGST